MSSLVKKIIIGVVILAVAYIAYSMFFKTSDSDNLISGSNSFSSDRSLADTQILGNQITQALIQIESLQLNRSIFENPIFKSLSDRSEQIISEPVGRKNPFAPLDDSSVNFDSNSPTLKSATTSNSSSNENQSSDQEESLPFGDLGL